MKIVLMSFLLYLNLGVINFAYSQFAGCPNQGADSIAHVDWRIKDPATGSVVGGNLEPNRVYELEIFETPYHPSPPHYISYQAIGVRGKSNGIMIYQSVLTAKNNPDANYPNDALERGIAKNVGSKGGVSSWGIIVNSSSQPFVIHAQAQCNASDSRSSPLRFSKNLHQPQDKQP